MTDPTSKFPPTRKKFFKKSALLLALVVLAILIDGTMSYDIFDPRPETYKMWLFLVLIVILGLVIFIADSSGTGKKGGPPD